MLNFEICKRLKEAGFPQDFHWNVARYHNMTGKLIPPYGECEVIDRASFISCPTLEDLIRELGDGFWKLIKASDHQWYATMQNGTVTRSNFFTPEEALANLYLSLHEPKL